METQTDDYTEEPNEHRVYLDGRRVEVIGADVDEATARVTVTYHDDEFDEATTHLDNKNALDDRHRDPLEIHISELAADDGATGVFEAIAALPDEAIDGTATWLTEHRTDGE